MSIGEAQIVGLLGEALRSGEAPWPADWSHESLSKVIDAIDYHGVAALLNESAAVVLWPPAVREALRRSALARSMWELRHQALLSDLLERLSASSVPSLLLKGSALAYGVYANAVHRSRGDSDLLIREGDRAKARQTLQTAGFRRLGEVQVLPENLGAQESWSLAANDGTTHCIDLHWKVLNAPALYSVFNFDEMWEARQPLPGLGTGGFAPSKAMLLAHACVHRAIHACSPYFVGGRTYFGGDRLIWLYDIALLGRAMSDEEWSVLTHFAAQRRFAGICLEGIAAAETRFGDFCPPEARDRLSSGGSSAYLRSGQLGRAVRDLWAVRGTTRKLRYALVRLLPAREFMRAKYADMGSRPLPVLYIRRFVELLRRRPSRMPGG